MQKDKWFAKKILQNFFLYRVCASQVTEEFSRVVHVTGAGEYGRCHCRIKHYLGYDHQPVADHMGDEREFVHRIAAKYAYNRDHLRDGFDLAPDIGGDNLPFVGGDHAH